MGNYGEGLIANGGDNFGMGGGPGQETILFKSADVLFELTCIRLCKNSIAKWHPRAWRFGAGQIGI